MMDRYRRDPANQPSRLIQVDSRGRVSLQKFTEAEYFTITVEEDGTIVLTPAIVVPLPTAKENFVAA